MAGPAALLLSGCAANPLTDSARVRPSVWHPSPSGAPGTDGRSCLHWIGMFESGGGYWSHCPIDEVDGEPTGVPIALPLESGPSSPITPVDLAVTVDGDVLISHVQPHGVRVFVKGNPKESFDVGLSPDDLPFGVAADPSGRKGYVVTYSTKDGGTCQIWSFATDADGERTSVAEWKCHCDSATGLEIDGDRAQPSFYVGLSNARGGDLVVRVTPRAADPKVQTVVKDRSGSKFPVYAVAHDPVRRLIHFAVSGKRAVFTAEIPTPESGPTEIDLSQDERDIATVLTSALVSQISYTPRRDRLVWAQGEAESPSAIAGTLLPGGIYQSRILAPMTSTGAVEFLGRLPPRAAVIWYPK